MSDRKPILVTGAHRTGTTWVGRMLAANDEVAYISEPLNVLHRPGVFRSRVKNWYTYINEENQVEYLSAFQGLLSLRYHLWPEILSLRSFKDFLRMGRDYYTFLAGRVQKQRVLLKDPFAVFSILWLSEKLGCDVVITIRHPGAFASSLKRLNWPFDFRDLLEQPALMHEYLDEDRADMESMRSDDIVGQSALLWRMIYRFVHSTLKLHPDFRVVRHEDLSLDPISGYKALYDSLGLTFDNEVSHKILNSSSSENPTELSKGKAYSVKLDSRANLDNWKKRLNTDEITRIRKMTESVSHLFYVDSEW